MKGGFIIAFIGGFYFNNIRCDLIPEADCSGVEREHDSVSAAPGGHFYI